MRKLITMIKLLKYSPYPMITVIPQVKAVSPRNYYRPKTVKMK